MKNLPQALAAEFVAMILFVWIGCGTATASMGSNDPGFYIGTSLAFGIGISVLAYCIGPVSGGHINPAVTTSLLLLGEIDVTSALAYIAVQFVGAVFGAGLVWLTMICDGENVRNDLKCIVEENLGINRVNDRLPIGSGFLIEFMGTFLLVFTVCMTAVSKKSTSGNVTPIAIGWSVLLAHLILIPHTGCGINPARSFGPHIFRVVTQPTANLRGWWVFYTAPFLGGGAAALAYKVICSADVEAEDGIKEPSVEGA